MKKTLSKILFFVIIGLFLYSCSFSGSVRVIYTNNTEKPLTIYTERIEEYYSRDTISDTLHLGPFSKFSYVISFSHQVDEATALGIPTHYILDMEVSSELGSCNKELRDSTNWVAREIGDGVFGGSNKWEAELILRPEDFE